MNKIIFSVAFYFDFIQAGKKEVELTSMNILEC